MAKIFVLAPDSFKESLSAVQVCQAMQSGILQVCPDAVCLAVPMADGGEGTVDALISSLKGQQVFCQVTGPLASQRINTYFGLVDEGRTAVIEMAKANGIHLLASSQRNPMLTSSYGTGEMIRQALDLGVEKIIIGLGGSVINDAGAGMAQALGAQFLDATGASIQVCGGNLNGIYQIDLTGLDARLQHTEMVIASDVNNPLCGTQGASVVFAPQKGATPEMVQQLDQNLHYFADCIEQQLGQQFQNIPGAGAAGGLGFGLMALTGAKLQSGVELVIQMTGLAEKIAQADMVLTGEGKIDSQTALGKTPFGVAQLAKRLNKPVVTFAGVIGEGVESLYQADFTKMVGINPPDCSLEEALKNAEFNLEKAVAGFIQSQI